MTARARITRFGDLLAGVVAMMTLAACSGGEGSSATTATGTGSDASSTAAATSETSSGSLSGSSGSGSASATTTATATATETGTVSTSVGPTSGSTSGPGTTTGGPAASCEAAADCLLIDDCCTCDVIGVDDKPPECNVPECFATTCSTDGLVLAAADCRMGQCNFAAVPCAPTPVACNTPPPDCPDGQLAAIVADCWGACIPARYCEQVPSCEGDPCGDGWFCVETQSGAPSRCHPMPETCQGELTCGCLFSYLPEFCNASCAEVDADTVLCEDGG